MSSRTGRRWADAGRAWRLAALGVLLLAGAGATLRPARAASGLGIPSGRLTATYQRWTYPDLSGEEHHQLTQPLDLMLLGDLREIGHRPIRATLLTRVDGDLEDKAFDHADLLFGYVEARRLGKLVDVWAGRRVLLDGTLTTGALDGAWVDVSGLPWIGVGGHFGRPVSFASGFEPPKWSTGAHGWLNGVPWLDLEARYERQEDQLLSVPVRSRIGGDLLLQLRDSWVGFAQADYEQRTATLERGRAGVRYRAAGPLHANVELFRYDPVFDPRSVFARMQSDPHWGWTVQADYDLLRSLTVEAHWTTRVFTRYVFGATAAQDGLQYDPTHSADLGLIFRPVPSVRTEATGGATSSKEGASLLGTLSAGWEYRPWGLDARLGGYLNAHDRRYNDPSGILQLFGDTGAGVKRNLATGGWVDLGVAPVGQLSLGVRGEAFRDESAFQSIRLLARISGYLY